MDEFDSLKIENQVCFPLYAAARKVVSAYTPYLKPLDLTYTQYITMLILWDKQTETVGSLCKRLHLDSGTMTPLLKKLENRGFITRSRDDSDERIVNVNLTVKGADLKYLASSIPEKVAGCFNLDPLETVALYNTLYKIIDNSKGE